MKIVIYGLPCAGKTTLMSKVENARVINGSNELQRLCGKEFSKLTNEEKEEVRIEYTKYIDQLNDMDIISDGHYSFGNDIVFTEADGNVYDVFFYLYCSPIELKKRYLSSKKNAKYALLTIEEIKNWQESEIRSLRNECHKNNKDFYVVDDNEIFNTKFFDFLKIVREGYSTVNIASNICNRIMVTYPKGKELYLIDGDKTIIMEDSYRFCCDGKTKVFENNFYTGYQSYLFMREYSELNGIDYKKISDLTINQKIKNIIKDREYIILSSGIESIWKEIKKKKNLDNIYASVDICADVKYYVTKFLKKNGYIIHAIGDSKIDLDMIKEANYGYLLISDRLSNSLKNERLRGVVEMYNDSIVVLEDVNPNLKDDIDICKSNSGINGGKLAKAHIRLGKEIGISIQKILPNTRTSILVLERGGRFFGDGVYSELDNGVFYSINPKNDEVPLFDTDYVLIVDSVINSGRSIKEIINNIEKNNPLIKIIIASNVIQRGSVELLSNYKVFTIRISDNYFIGRNQDKQIGNTGPDTADRLYNLIRK